MSPGWIRSTAAFDSRSDANSSAARCNAPTFLVNTKFCYKSSSLAAKFARFIKAEALQWQSARNCTNQINGLENLTLLNSCTANDWSIDRLHISRVGLLHPKPAHVEGLQFRDAQPGRCGYATINALSLVDCFDRSTDFFPKIRTPITAALDRMTLLIHAPRSSSRVSRRLYRRFDFEVVTALRQRAKRLGPSISAEESITPPRRLS
jgi:hypothetical protein